MQNCHVGDSDKRRYGMILGRDLITVLRINPKLSEHVIKADDGPLKGSSSPMFDLGTYDLKYLSTGEITPKESSVDAHSEEINESEQVHNYTKQLHKILDAKYKTI